MMITFFLFEIFIRLCHAIELDHDQPFLYITDPRNTRAQLGGSVRLSCRLCWKDAFGNNWEGYTPPVQVQWIINGFGYQIDSLEDIYQRRLVVTGNRSDGNYDLLINKVQLEDEGNFACQARIMHSRLSTSADARESGWNRNHRTTGQSVMMIVRSKEAHLTVFSPLKRFGLFVGKFLTRPEVMAGSASRQEPKIFVQIGIPIYLTCFSDGSRPPALLEINFNNENIVLSSRNRTACKRMEESHWCVGNATSFHHAVFNLLVTEYRKYIHTIKGESVRLILKLLVKGEFPTPLSVKCEVKNVKKFTESGSLRKPFKAVASSTIHLHDIYNMSIHRFSVWNDSNSRESVKFRCEGFVSLLAGQNVTLRWSLNRQKVAEMYHLKMQKTGNMGRFSADFEAQHSKLPLEFTLRCSVKSRILVSSSNIHVVFRHRKIKVTINKEFFPQINRHFILTLEKARNSSKLFHIKEYFEVQDEAHPNELHATSVPQNVIKESDLGLEFNCGSVNASNTLSDWQAGVFGENGKTIWRKMGAWQKFTLSWTALLQITPISSERRAFLYSRSQGEPQNVNSSGFYSSQTSEIFLLRCRIKGLLETSTFFIFNQDSNFAMAKARGSQFVDTELKSLTLLIVPLTIFGLVVLAVFLKRWNKDPSDNVEFLPLQLQTMICSDANNPNSKESNDTIKATTQKNGSALRLLPTIEIRPEFGPKPSGLLQLELTHLAVTTRSHPPE